MILQPRRALTLLLPYVSIYPHSPSDTTSRDAVGASEGHARSKEEAAKENTLKLIKRKAIAQPVRVWLGIELKSDTPSATQKDRELFGNFWCLG